MRSNLPDSDCRNKMHYRLGMGTTGFTCETLAYWAAINRRRICRQRGAREGGQCKGSMPG